MIGCQWRIVKPPVVQVIICSIKIPWLEKKNIRLHIKANVVMMVLHKDEHSPVFKCMAIEENQGQTIHEQVDCKSLLASVSVLHSLRTSAIYLHLHSITLNECLWHHMS